MMFEDRERAESATQSFVLLSVTEATHNNTLH